MKNYIISEEKLKYLIERDWRLIELENAGVDNWEGYNYIEEDEETYTIEDELKKYREYEV